MACQVPSEDPVTSEAPLKTAEVRGSAGMTVQAGPPSCVRRHGCLHQLAYRPTGLVLDPAADRKRREDDGETGLDGVALADALAATVGPRLRWTFGQQPATAFR